MTQKCGTKFGVVGMVRKRGSGIKGFVLMLKYHHEKISVVRNKSEIWGEKCKNTIAIGV